MRAVAIIPARMASSRFPGKPLVPLLGLPMVEHVRRRVMLTEGVDEAIVATCDQEIREVVEEFGGRVVMTSERHERGTDRVAEAAEEVGADLIVNVQGDEPLITPEAVKRAITPLVESAHVQATNLVVPIRDRAELTDPNVVKVVADKKGDILYLSRQPIPSLSNQNSPAPPLLKQLGVYAFRSSFLREYAMAEITPLEQTESIDMLRILEHGHKLRMVCIPDRMLGVDLPEHVSIVEDLLREDPITRQYLP